MAPKTLLPNKEIAMTRALTRRARIMAILKSGESGFRLFYRFPLFANCAASRSRFMAAMKSMLISLGQTAEHSP